MGITEYQANEKLKRHTYDKHLLRGTNIILINSIPPDNISNVFKEMHIHIRGVTGYHHV